MLLALVVLVGFGLLFMFAFDEGLQGGPQTMESVIAQQAKDIESLESGISNGEKQLAGSPALLARNKDLGALKRENLFRDGKIDSLKKGIASVTDAIAAKTAEIEGYKDQYRAMTRAKAKGETLGRLETRKGDVYENVTIREVTAIGLQIMHDGGQKRIAFEELSAEIQDRFQFDPRQKAAAVAREEAERNEHETAVSAATAAESQKMADQREKEAEANREKLEKDLALKKSRIESLKDEIKALEEAIPKEGLKPISRAPQMKIQLSAKQRQLSALQADVARQELSL
jgi:hypothetical protein